MKKKALIQRLEEVSYAMDSYPQDVTLVTAVKELRDIQNRLDEIINEIEDEGVSEEEKVEINEG
jgi:hypothetical protein